MNEHKWTNRKKEWLPVSLWMKEKAHLEKDTLEGLLDYF